MAWLLKETILGIEWIKEHGIQVKRRLFSLCSFSIPVILKYHCSLFIENVVRTPWGWHTLTAPEEALLKNRDIIWCEPEFIFCFLSIKKRRERMSDMCLPNAHDSFSLENPFCSSIGFRPRGSEWSQLITQMENYVTRSGSRSRRSVSFVRKCSRICTNSSLLPPTYSNFPLKLCCMKTPPETCPWLVLSCEKWDGLEEVCEGRKNCEGQQHYFSRIGATYFLPSIIHIICQKQQ